MTYSIKDEGVHWVNKRTPVHILHLSHQPHILGRKLIFPAMPICNIHSRGQFIMNVPQNYQFDHVATSFKNA